jgi:hypothetical protein
MSEITVTRNFHKIFKDAMEERNYVMLQKCWDEFTGEIGYENSERTAAVSEKGRQDAEYRNAQGRGDSGILTSKLK